MSETFKELIHQYHAANKAGNEKEAEKIYKKITAIKPNFKKWHDKDERKRKVKP